MKTANVSDLIVGTIFVYEKDIYEVVSRDEYPFIECKWLDGPTKYDANILFGGHAETVKVLKGGVIHCNFKQKGNTYYMEKDYTEMINQ